MSHKRATEADIPELLQLIETCYRGDVARTGWTCESDIVSGSRTNPECLREEINAPGGSYLLRNDDQGKIIGCVYIKINADHKYIYIGSLCVYPSLQSQGIGKSLLADAEEIARDAGCKKMCVKVISVRKELIDWYERMDYKFVGDLIPLPDSSGTPIVPLQLGSWEKRLD